MQYIIRNKWISLGGSSYVRDINEKDLFKVKGKFWTFTRKKIFKEMNDDVIYIIRNKFWKLFHYRAFVLEPDGKTKVATVTKKIFTLHDKYLIESKFGDITITGNILGYDYHIVFNGEEVAHISRKISLRDSFVLDVYRDGLDDKFIIALVIAIDNITDEARSDASSASYSSSN